MSEDVISTPISFENFKKIILMLKELLDKGNLDFRFGKEFTGLKIEEEEELTKKELFEKFGVTEELYDEALSELVRILSMILSQKKDKVFKKLQDKESERDLLSEKCTLVEKEIISEKLYRKYFMDVTYKTAVIDTIDWEVNRKTILDSSKKRFPIALINLKLIKDLGNPFETDSFSFECNLDVIENLIKEFTKIRELIIEQEKIGD